MVLVGGRSMDDDRFTSSEWRRLTLPGGEMSSDDRRRMVFPFGLASSYVAIFFSLMPPCTSWPSSSFRPTIKLSTISTSLCWAGCGGSDLFLRSSGKSVKSPVACITRSDAACFSENDRWSGALAVVPAPAPELSRSHPLSPVSLPLSFLPNVLSLDAMTTNLSDERRRSASPAAACFGRNSVEDPRRSPLDVALVGLPNGFCKDRRLCRF